MTGWLILAAVLLVAGVAGYVYADRRLARMDEADQGDRPGDDGQFVDWPPLRHPESEPTDGDTK